MNNEIKNDEIPDTDDLAKLEFKWSSDCETMYYPLANGLQIVIGIETSQSKDNYGMATSLSLYWKLSFEVSGHYGIRDDPTIGQITTLLTALKGE